MKRLDPIMKARFVRLAAKRERRRHRHRLRRIISDSDAETADSGAVFKGPDALAIADDARLTEISLPARLCLRTNYDETVSSIATIRETILGLGHQVKLHFDNVIELDPAAALLLTAEAYRCRHLRTQSAQRLQLGTYPADVEVLLQLREMGFFKLMHVDGLETDYPDNRGIEGRAHFLPFYTFRKVEAEVAAKIADLIAVTCVKMDVASKRRMTGALKEAMGNAVEHAYSQKTGPYEVLSDRYWVAGSVHPTAQEMMLMVFDQGVGIPETLGPNAFERIMAMLRLDWSPSDGHMIAAATELHRTSTGEPGRGRGFRDMKRFVDFCDDGELRILSNYGRYIYKKDGQDVANETLSVGGTLIEWRVRHGEAVKLEDA